MKKIRKCFIICLAILYACSLSMTGMASGDVKSNYVIDEVGLLTDEETQELNERASEIAENYHCSVYAVITEYYYEYSDYDVEDAAQNYYQENQLGYGDAKDGFLLFLSMSDRDYCLLAYGDFGNASLTDYGKDEMSSSFLSYFGDDDWYGGFSDYLDTSEEYLEMSQNGEPIDYDTDTMSGGMRFLMSYGFAAIVAVISGFVACGFMKSNMKSVKTAAKAHTYIKDGKIDMRVREDRFSHMTQVRQRIERESSKSRSGGSRGGTRVNSRGFSTKSGKF